MRVRLLRIDQEDLNLFEFDYDVTFMIFFLNADKKVYARYGGRDSENAENRQSLAGLKYTMNSVLSMHQREEKIFARRVEEGPKYIRDVPGARRGGCFHCHQVKEVLNSDLQRSGKWQRDLVWRFPLPENLGFELEVNRGNVIKTVKDPSPARTAGLAAGDIVQRLNNIPIHSFGDAQFALDIAPKTGSIEVFWLRGDQTLKNKLELTDGWRKTDVSWRPSMQRLVPNVRLYGADLSVDEKKSIGLSAARLAFRQRDPITLQAKAAGIRPGDIILGVDDQPLEMHVDQFLGYVQRNYFIGDSVTVNLVREGKRMNLPMNLDR